MANEKYRYYRRRGNTTVTAVQLDLDTDGFTYTKWGAEQRCQAGDWIINSDNGCHTVANSSFGRTYREISPGRYVKHTRVRAIQATSPGTIKTLEGKTHYSAGDYLIENNDDGSDSYAITEARFHQLYELAEDQ